LDIPAVIQWVANNLGAFMKTSQTQPSEIIHDLANFDERKSIGHLLN
jgi:hypothetical protein